jgi:hypothetical protein
MELHHFKAACLPDHALVAWAVHEGHTTSMDVDMDGVTAPA